MLYVCGYAVATPRGAVRRVNINWLEEGKLAVKTVAHAIDPTLGVGSMAESSTVSTMKAGTRRRLLRGDGLSPVLHRELTVHVLQRTVGSLRLLCADAATNSV